MSGPKITPGFLLPLSFAGCVIAADSGDDFSNNLFSDLAPLLSLLGEQVTMQFMSQAMGWTDNVILAMAPLGIITIIVSAIRVGGPSWLKALVGRARENLAVVEAVVRSMGAAPIGEFICLLPEGFRDGEDAKWGVPEVVTLEGAINAGFLDEIQPNLPETFYPTQRAEEGSARHKIRGPKIIVTRNPGADAPNISLNMNNQSGTGGLLWVAALGTVLQLGVLVFSGFATYHPRLMFLKDGRPIVPYAYPCTAAGTLLLVLGMMMCGHVVDSSTEETRYRTGLGSTARMVWLQKAGTVSDQVFGSFAITARDDRTVVLASRRAGKRRHPAGWVDRAVQAIADAVTQLLYSSTASQIRKNNSQSTAAVSAEQSHTAILASKTVLGVLMGLCGFFVQFIGLRGMHWSASIAQLGATLVMTAFRAWVRLGLAKPAEARRLIPGFELDWLATVLGHPDKASWPATSNCEELIKDWSIISGGGLSTLKRWEVGRSTQPEPPHSKAQALMVVRESLGSRAQWRGPAFGEAETLARAIEIVMDKLIGPQPGEFIWTLGAHYAGSSDHTIRFNLEKKNNKWTADVKEIDAALSLWLYSAMEHDLGHDIGVEWSPNPEPHPLTKIDGNSLQLLGPSTPSLRRDLQWWTTRDAPDVIEVDMYDKTGWCGVHGSRTSYKKINPSIRRDEPVEAGWFMMWNRLWNMMCNVNSYRLIGYGITDGDTAETAETAQDGEEWPDIDCKAPSPTQ